MRMPRRSRRRNRREDDAEERTPGKHQGHNSACLLSPCQALARIFAPNAPSGSGAARGDLTHSGTMGFTQSSGVAENDSLFLCYSAALVRQAKPGLSCELKGVHRVKCLWDT
jgi:hypothetical protein